MRTMLLRFPLAAVFALAACGGDTKTVTKEIPAAPCVIEQGASGPELVCPDGSRAPIPQGGACTISGQTGGALTLTCPDGSTATIPAEGCTAIAGEGGGFTLRCPGIDVTVPGPATTEVAGTARLYGEQDSSGITVELEGTDFSGTTDAAGAFSIEGVPSGLYDVTASRPGWREQRFENVLVYGVTRTLDIELRRAKLVQQATDAELLDRQGDRPTSAGALALSINDNRPVLIRAGDDQATFLRNAIGQVAFSPDGAFLVANGELWNVATATTVPVGGDISRFWFSADGSHLAYNRGSGATSKFAVRELASGTEVALNGQAAFNRVYSNGDDFYFVLAGDVELWRLRVGAGAPETIGSGLGNASSNLSLNFTTGDRLYVFGQGFGGVSGLDLVNLANNEVDRIMASISAFRTSADGARVAYVRDDSELERVVEIQDVSTDETRIPADGGTLSVTAMSADGRYLIYRRTSSGLSDWFLYDWNSDTSTPLLEDSGGSASFHAGDEQILLVRDVGLATYTVEGGGTRVITEDGALAPETQNGPPVRSPDGRFAIVQLDGPPRTGLLDLATLELSDLGVQVGTPTFSGDSKLFAGVGLGEPSPRLHVWSLPSMAEETIAGGADDFEFSPSGGEIVLRRIEAGSDQLAVYRRDTRETVPLDAASITLLGVVEGEVIYMRRPAPGEDPAPAAGVWSAPLR